MSIICFVVPVFKVEERQLRKCVESLQTQTITDIEILLIDDKSPDSCGQICEDIARTDERIKVIHHKNNQGLSAARNTGIEHATSEWIAFIDGDDWVDENMAETLLSEIECNDADMFIYSGYREFKERTVKCAFIYPHRTEFSSYHDRNELEERYLLEQSKYRVMNSFPLQSACIRLVNRRLFEKGLRFIDVRFAEDGLFHLYSVEASSKVVYLNYNFYHYRDTSNSMVNGYRQNAVIEQIEFISEVIKFADENKKDDSFKKCINYIKFIAMQLCVWQNLFNKENKKSYIRKQLDAARVFNRYPFNNVLKELRIKDLAKNQWLKYMLFRIRFYQSAVYARELFKRLSNAERQ